ncbi:MAG: bifunctional transaldolase/phosoglucose isomerase, partial [Blastocatellia bacterium]|nr:bifunctional transaldolase/phosoglucose isomerase [Blastocatellia bacterium]
MNPLKALHEHKQSPWLDYIRRSLITSGELQRLIDEDGLMGVTSNPAIFEKAITGSNDYTDALAALEPENLDAMALYERLAIKDIQDSTDVMRSVYDKTNKRDGYVSLEVSPYLAKDTQGTIDEARRLWKAVDRPNLMVKVPATPEGVPAIQTLISEGININVTLLFAQSAYEEVAEAYISGLETFVANGGDPSHVASVASFFISRIDSMIDSQLAAKAKADPANAALINSLQGKVAIANAKLTYQAYKDIYRSARWKALEEKGAQTQRLLWASTSTKNPSYRDVLYVEELIGAETVNTIPPATFDAFRDHGKLRGSLEEDLDGAHDIMDTLAKVGVSMKDATDNLLSEAVRLFAEPFEKLLRSVDKKCKLVSWTKINKQSLQLTAEQDGQFKAALEDWQVGGKVRRLWYRDAKLWTGTDESQWLGWLGITEDQLNNSDHLRKVAEDVKAAGFETAMVLGMGGSSLCPEVLKMTFGKIEGAPELHVLDSTDPAQVATFAGKIDPAKTVFIVSSKSGSTLEPNIFKQY